MANCSCVTACSLSGDYATCALRAFHKEWQAVKQTKKQKLAAYVKGLTGDDLNLNAMFDIQVRVLAGSTQQLWYAAAAAWCCMTVALVAGAPLASAATTGRFHENSLHVPTLTSPCRSSASTSTSASS